MYIRGIKYEMFFEFYYIFIKYFDKNIIIVLVKLNYLFF